MTPMRAPGLLREPLVHFLVAGAAIFLLFAVFARTQSETVGAREIVVDRSALLQFMQYRAKVFEPATFAAKLDALTAAQHKQLVDDYVREEVLFREAKGLGLEQGDYVLRERLVQKMGFMLEAAAVEPTEKELQSYFDANSAPYALPESWTFTHVFIDPSSRGVARSERVSCRMLAILNRLKARFNDAPRYSDRYPFLQNYADRPADYISSHFGAEFMTRLAALPVNEGKWQGPLRSSQGFHLVLITARSAGRIPKLSELRAQVLVDFKRDRAAAELERATGSLIATYKVTIN
jgi:PPIC-type PPIASE domain